MSKTNLAKDWALDGDLEDIKRAENSLIKTFTMAVDGKITKEKLENYPVENYVKDQVRYILRAADGYHHRLTDIHRLADINEEK